MKSLCKYLGVVVAMCALLLSGVSRAALGIEGVRPLEGVLMDMQGAPWEAVEMAAREQGQSDGPRFRSMPESVPFYATFEGDFVPQDAQTKLAIFSDDGCDVLIDGVRVHAQKDRRMDMLKLNESLHRIEFAMQAGRSYKIKVEFSNVVYKGQGDMDGLSLFAYTGAAAPNPTATPVATAMPVAPVAPESWGRLRIFRSNNGQMGEEITTSAGGASGAGARAMSASTGTQQAATVSGYIWLMFEFRLGTGEHLAPDFLTMNWMTREDSAPVAETPVRDVAPAFWFMSEREYLYFQGGQWTTHPDYQSSRPIQGTIIRVRSLLNTRELHNGPQSLMLAEPDCDGEDCQDYDFAMPHRPLDEIKFQIYDQGSRDWVTSYTRQLLPQRINVKNVVLTKAECSDKGLDYIRYDPESEDPNIANPTITFAFEDGEQRTDDRYDYQVHLRETSNVYSWTNDVVLTGTASATNGNGSGTVSLPPDLKRGVYGFDVIVLKHGLKEYDQDWHPVLGEGYIDTVNLRSYNASFRTTSLNVEDEENDGNSILKFRYRPEGSYWYAGATRYDPLASVKIEALDGALQRGANPVDGPVAVNVEHTVDAPEVEDAEAGEGRVIATGVDDLGFLYRDHKGKRLWPRSARFVNPSAELYVEQSTGRDAYGRETWQRKDGGIIGGQARAMLRLVVPSGVRVSEAEATLTIRDEYANYRAGTPREKTARVRFGVPDGWKVKRRGEADFTSAGAGDVPGQAANVDRTFLFESAWNTTSEPLGNNGMHLVSLGAPLHFEGGGPRRERAVAPRSFDVRNVVIESATATPGNADYFKWDPASPDESLRAPRIRFSIRDEGDPHQYRWTVWFRETKYLHRDSSTNWTSEASSISGVATEPGEVTLDLADSALSGHLDEETHPRGPYTYDIRVVEYENTPPTDDQSSESGSLDRIQLKQPYNLWIPFQFQQNGQARNGHDMWLDMPNDNSGDYEMRANYYLFPNPELGGQGAKKIEMVPLGPDLRERPKYLGPTSTGTLHGSDTGMVAYRVKPEDPDGDWRLIFTGEDASGPGHPKRRDHTEQRMIPVNQIGGVRSMIPFDTYEGRPNQTQQPASGWYALWINATRVRKKVVNANPAISVSDLVDDLTAQASRRYPPTQFEWAAINGGYYDTRDKNVSQPKPIIASAGTGRRGRWLHGSPTKTGSGQPLRRWSFGFNDRFSGSSGFDIGLMQPTGTSRPLPPGYRSSDFAVPRALENRFDFGLSGLLSLINDGQPVVRQSRSSDPASAVRNGIYIGPPNGGWERSGLEFYSPYTYHAALAWTGDARHLFFVVHRSPRNAMHTRNLFANYRQVHSNGSYRDEWVGPGPVVQRLNAILRNPTERSIPRMRNFPRRISGAMMLDGGHSATLKYQRLLGYSGSTPLYETEGVWQNRTSRNPRGGAPASSHGRRTIELQPTLPTLVQVVR